MVTVSDLGFGLAVLVGLGIGVGMGGFGLVTVAVGSRFGMVVCGSGSGEVSGASLSARKA